MAYFMILLAGALFCNCIPHLTCGLSGTDFPTPFATPRGLANSPPWLNFLWGASNLAVAIVITIRRFAPIETIHGVILLAAGFLLAGTYLSMHFSKTRKV